MNGLFHNFAEIAIHFYTLFNTVAPSGCRQITTAPRIFDVNSALFNKQLYSKVTSNELNYVNQNFI